MTTRDAKRFMKMSFLCLQIDNETMNARDLYYHIRHETNMLEADMFMPRELLEDIYETELPEPDDLSEEMEFLNECIKKVDAVIKEEESHIWKNCIKIEELKKQKLRKKDEMLRRIIRISEA